MLITLLLSILGGPLFDGNLDFFFFPWMGSQNVPFASKTMYAKLFLKTLVFRGSSMSMISIFLKENKVFLCVIIDDLENSLSLTI